MGRNFRWSETKNHFLKTEPGISFEEIVEAMAQGRLLDVRQNKSRSYRDQRLLIVDVHDFRGSSRSTRLKPKSSSRPHFRVGS